MNKPKDERTRMNLAIPGKKKEALEDFLSAEPKGSLGSMTEPAPLPEVVEKFPWEQQGVRRDVIKQYNLRLSEPDLLKLRYVVEQRMAKSINSYILEVLLPKLDEDLEKLRKRGMA